MKRRSPGPRGSPEPESGNGINLKNKSIPYFLLIAKYLREPPAFLKAKAASESQGKPRIAELFAPRMRFKTGMLFLGEFFHVFAYGTTIWLNFYFQRYRQWSPVDAIAIVGLSYFVGSLGYILSAIVGEFYLKRRNVIIIWAQLGAVSFAAMIWWAQSVWDSLRFAWMAPR